MKKQYECKSCGKEIDYDAKIGHHPKSITCECGKRAKKMITVPAVHYKGKDFTLSNEQ